MRSDTIHVVRQCASSRGTREGSRACRELRPQNNGKGYQSGVMSIEKERMHKLGVATNVLMQKSCTPATTDIGPATVRRVQKKYPLPHSSKIAVVHYNIVDNCVLWNAAGDPRGSYGEVSSEKVTPSSETPGTNLQSMMPTAMRSPTAMITPWSTSRCRLPPFCCQGVSLSRGTVRDENRSPCSSCVW